MKKISLAVLVAALIPAIVLITSDKDTRVSAPSDFRDAPGAIGQLGGNSVDVEADITPVEVPSGKAQSQTYSGPFTPEAAAKNAFFYGQNVSPCGGSGNVPAHAFVMQNDKSMPMRYFASHEYFFSAAAGGDRRLDDRYGVVNIPGEGKKQDAHIFVPFYWQGCSKGSLGYGQGNPRSFINSITVSMKIDAVGTIGAKTFSPPWRNADCDAIEARAQASGGLLGYCFTFKKIESPAVYSNYRNSLGGQTPKNTIWCTNMGGAIVDNAGQCVGEPGPEEEFKIEEESKCCSATMAGENICYSGTAPDYDKFYVVRCKSGRVDAVLSQRKNCSDTKEIGQGGNLCGAGLFNYASRSFRESNGAKNYYIVNPWQIAEKATMPVPNETPVYKACYNYLMSAENKYGVFGE